MQHKIFRNRVLTFIFILILAFPILNLKNKLVKDAANNDNRKRASRPYLKKGRIDEFAGAYEAFYNDNFCIRSILVKYFNLFHLKVLKKSPNQELVVLGKDGWLFLGKTEDESFTGKNRFTHQELEAFRAELEFRQRYLKERGIKFYFLIAPIKAAIYPEKIINSDYRNFNQTWGEQLLAYLNKYSTLKPIDVYSALRESKSENLLYLKLDNHWNEFGAWYATKQILKTMKKDFPQLRVLDLKNFRSSKTFETKGCILKLLATPLGYRDEYFELTPKDGFKAEKVKTENYSVDKTHNYALEFEIEKEVENSDQPKILIISDSFGVNIFPFISEEFSRTVKIFDIWQYKLNEKIVAAEKPDIVLVISLESNLRNMLKFQSRLKAK